MKFSATKFNIKKLDFIACSMQVSTHGLNFAMFSIYECRVYRFELVKCYSLVMDNLPR